MPHPATDSQNDRTRWLLEGLSIRSHESAMRHLCHGWLEFTPAVAAMVCLQSFAGSSGCFLRQNEAPQYFSACPTEESQNAELVGEATQNFSRQPPLNLEWDGQHVGRVETWTTNEGETTVMDWLEESSARMLWARRQIDERLQQDKLDALAEFAAGAGHEINNPVATISGRIQALLQGETDAERRRQLLSIGGQALRIRDMIGDTMLFARPPLPKPELLDLKTVLPEIVRPLSGELSSATFTCRVPEAVPIFADRGQLAVVITELLRNSLEWQDNGGTIAIAARPVELPEGPTAEIVIEDDGESFTPQDEPHVFDPFYCGRQAGRGLGFGLPKCWRIVSNHRGRIGIASLPHQGTRVTIHWPAHAPAAASEP